MSRTILSAQPVTSHETTTPVRRERLQGLLALLVGLAYVTVQSQIHHHYHPSQAGGWREIPFYGVAGLLGWLVAFGIAFIGPHRAAHTETVSRRTALVLVIFAVPATIVSWFTPIPVCLAAAAVLLSRRARAVSPATRLDSVIVALAALTVVEMVALGTVLRFLVSS